LSSKEGFNSPSSFSNPKIPLEEFSENSIIFERRDSIKETFTTNTFTKITMCVLYLLFVIGALIGSALVIFSALWDVKQGVPIDQGMFVAYAAYLGTPTAVAIGFYAWKSKAENLLKIKSSLDNTESTENHPLLDTIAGMGGDD